MGIAAKINNNKKQHLAKRSCEHVMHEKMPDVIFWTSGRLWLSITTSIDPLNGKKTHYNNTRQII